MKANTQAYGVKAYSVRTKRFRIYRVWLACGHTTQRVVLDGRPWRPTRLACYRCTDAGNHARGLSIPSLRPRIIGYPSTVWARPRCGRGVKWLRKKAP